jgi:hypothetical protein
MTCAAAGLALAVAALAACTRSDPAPTETSAVVPSTTTSTTPTSTAPSTTATSAGPAFPAGLPDAAKTKDKAGAEAFVKHFVTIVNRAWTRPDPNTISTFCLPTSQSCKALVDIAEDLKAKDQRYASDPVRLGKAIGLSPVDGETRVQLESGQTGAKIVDATGATVETEKASASTRMFYLRWGQAGWAISAIKAVE